LNGTRIYDGLYQGFSHGRKRKFVKILSTGKLLRNSSSKINKNSFDRISYENNIGKAIENDVTSVDSGT